MLPRTQWTTPSRILTLAAVLAGIAGCARPSVIGAAARVPNPVDAGSDCAAFRSPQLTADLDERSGAVARDGNRVRLLVNGSESFARRFEVARDADVILAKTFVLGDDEVCNRVADLMCERARAGAYVVLQYDVRGSLGRAESVPALLGRMAPVLPIPDGALVERLREAGVLVVASEAPTRPLEIDEWARSAGFVLTDPLAVMERTTQTLRILNHAGHEKYWITGHRRSGGALELDAIVGGMNLASEYAYGGTGNVDAGSGRAGWRDTDVEIEGPVVNDIVSRYWRSLTTELGRAPDWTPNPPQAAVGGARARFVWNDPLVDQRRAVERTYEALIDAVPSGSPLRIATAYFSPETLVRKALRRAVERNVALSIVTNSPESTDISLVADASRAAYLALLELGGDVSLYEWRSRPQAGESTLHAKVAEFGACGPVIVGSANLDAQSSEHNGEGVLVIEDPALRARFAEVYAGDTSGEHASRVTLDSIRDDSTWKRVRDWSAGALARYWL